MPGEDGAGVLADPVDCNLYRAFEQRFPADRSRLLLETGDGRAWTYADAVLESGRVANWLTCRGLRPGDRLTVQAPKSVDWLALYLGCLRAGIALHPLNDGYQPRELAWFIGDARPSLLVCAPGHRPLFEKLAHRTSGTSIPVETLGESGDGSASAGWADAAASFATVASTRDDLAVLLYSSGTTGPPKGAMQTHGSLLSNARALADAWGFTTSDRLLHALPVYHAHGLFVGVGCALMSGASMVYLKRFDPDEVLARLPDCTVMMGVPTYYTRLLGLAEFKADRCQSMRLFVSGSAPLLPATHAAFETRTGHRILERYGLTETGMNTSNPLSGERRPGSVGLPLPGTQVRVVDDDGRELGADMPGHVEVKGPNVFSGYWNRPAETAEAFTPDGWFRTGDLGRLSRDGYLSIVGRSKDLIITGGLNVYPREVEEVLDALPGVAESAVIGIPHPDLGETVIAVVVPRAGQAPAEQDILDAIRVDLAGFKRPKRVFFLAELPRNTLGKVQKNELRRQIAEAATPPEAPR